MSDLKNYTIAVAGTGYVNLSISTLLFQHLWTLRKQKRRSGVIGVYCLS